MDVLPLQNSKFVIWLPLLNHNYLARHISHLIDLNFQFTLLICCYWISRGHLKPLIHLVPVSKFQNQNQIKLEVICDFLGDALIKTHLHTRTAYTCKALVI